MATHEGLSKNIKSPATCNSLRLERSQDHIQNKNKQPTNVPSQIQVRKQSHHQQYIVALIILSHYIISIFNYFCLLFQIIQIIIIHMDMMMNHDACPERVVQNFLIVDFGGYEWVVSWVCCCASPKKTQETSSRLQTLFLMVQSYNLEQRYSVTESRLPAADLHIDLLPSAAAAAPSLESLRRHPSSYLAELQDLHQ